MQNPRDVLTPDALAMLQAIAEQGSFAAAARSLSLVPSALTYRVRQIEDALDVLLFDRSSRQARLTEAGAELLRGGSRLLLEIDAMANRVKRVATGWEPQFTLAVDSIVMQSVVMELCEAFYALQPPTRLRIREETLSGTLAALTSGQADLAIGVVMVPTHLSEIHTEVLGRLAFVFCVAPHHPLANAQEPVQDDDILQHRAVSVADSVQRGAGLSFGLLGGQDVLTVPTMQAKLQAQLRGLGIGYLPQCLARPYIESGRLKALRIARARTEGQFRYAWRNHPNTGKALQWWLGQLQSPVTRAALLGQHV
ncbi:MAG: LysR family transcriptional regulator [Burkholderiaceae bacterium]